MSSKYTVLSESVQCKKCTILWRTSLPIYTACEDHRSGIYDVTLLFEYRRDWLNFMLGPRVVRIPTKDYGNGKWVGLKIDDKMFDRVLSVVNGKYITCELMRNSLQSEKDALFEFKSTATIAIDVDEKSDEDARFLKKVNLLKYLDLVKAYGGIEKFYSNYITKSEKEIHRDFMFIHNIKLDDVEISGILQALALYIRYRDDKHIEEMTRAMMVH